jgi:S-adenosylmethionine decarboxylase proenzyme
MNNPQSAPAMQATTTAYGSHMLLDFWGALGLSDIHFIEKAIRSAAVVCGATVIDVHLHSFGAGQGVTGVAILAESHISIHTWPETGFAALDIFRLRSMQCGSSCTRASCGVSTSI